MAQRIKRTPLLLLLLIIPGGFLLLPPVVTLLGRTKTEGQLLSGDNR